MPPVVKAPSFAMISGAQVHRVLQERHREVVRLVESAYRVHGAGDTVNPPSYFLRFPDRPTARIIALPASIGGDVRVDGLKWISSFPENVAAGIPRASAVLILNDHDTGYPLACLESSIISAARTAASAALAAATLSAERGYGRAGSVSSGSDSSPVTSTSTSSDAVWNSTRSACTTFRGSTRTGSRDIWGGWERAGGSPCTVVRRS